MKLPESGAAFSYVTPSHRDPAELMDVPYVLYHSRTIPFDQRTNQQLIEVMREHPSVIEREQAAFVLAERGAEALDALEWFVTHEKDRTARVNGLWALQKIGGSRALSSIERAAAEDPDIEVREWATWFQEELTGVSGPEAKRPYRIDSSKVWEQTIPLHVHGYAFVTLPDGQQIRAVIAPQLFDSIMGRVLACTNVATRWTDLMVEKCLFGYNPDGSNYYEVFHFKGISSRPDPRHGFMNYQAYSVRTFYPSGKTLDVSVPPIANVTVCLDRTAAIQLSEHVMIEPKYGPSPDGNNAAVRRVRGRFYGLAYVNIERFLKTGVLGPGEVQLSTMHHPEVAKYTNAFIAGTFKGKLSDLDGDGVLDVNTITCHATLDGQLDLDGDGQPDVDPFDPCAAQPN